jgi:hypothetical protein
MNGSFEGFCHGPQHSPGPSKHNIKVCAPLYYSDEKNRMIHLLRLMALRQLFPTLPFPTQV